MADMVVSFTVDFTKDMHSIVDMANVEIIFEKNNKRYVGTMDVAPRNKPLECSIAS